MIEFKVRFEKKYGKIKKGNKLSKIFKTEIKNRINKYLDSFKKRITYKKNYLSSFHIKQINKFPDQVDSFNKLLDYTVTLNNTIVDQFLKNIYKKSDLDKILKEAEFGFEKKNVMDFGVKIGEKMGNYFNMLTGRDIKDMEFELNKGYFNKIYNYNSKIKNPTIDDVKIFKKSLSDSIKEVCEEIEFIINNKIEGIKNKITKSEIQKMFDDI